MKRTMIRASFVCFGIVSVASLSACGIGTDDVSTGSAVSEPTSQPAPSQSVGELEQQVTGALQGKCDKYLDVTAPDQLEESASANEKRVYEFARNFCLEQFANGESGKGVQQEPAKPKSPEHEPKPSPSSTCFGELDRSLPMPGDEPTLELMPEEPDVDGPAKPRTLEFQIPPGCEKEYLQREKELAGQQMG